MNLDIAKCGTRRNSKQVRVGTLKIGGDAPIVIQSMANTPTKDVEATVGQIHRLEEAGCELIRVAVPDEEAVHALSAIKSRIRIPLAADIHFDYRLALGAIEAGVDKLRLNPGNIKDPDKIKLIADTAREKGIPIRIGVNAGSMDRRRYGDPTPETLVASAMDEISLLESRGFEDIIISLKSFDVPTTIDAYRLVSKATEYPLHLGITEAGLLAQGTLRSAIGIGTLLSEGIGDTFRVSLTADPVEEVRVALEILKALNIREHGFTIVSCPTCARCGLNLEEVATEVERRMRSLGDIPPIKVAVMGCIVNGPGEARDADVGIAGAKEGGVIFADGHAIKRVSRDVMIDALMSEIERIVQNYSRPK
jgi:(E)-4-hydroxy-3-methylbut-2-enyl-diphosphate synthase